MNNTVKFETNGMVSDSHSFLFRKFNVSKGDKMFYMNLYYNEFRENARNTSYPYEKIVCTIDDMRQVVAYDHVCAKYRNSYRRKENFIETNCTMLDIDNADTEDSSKWVNPIDVQKVFPNVPMFIVYSRNHMKVKNGKMARPKFHVYFPDVVFHSSEEYEKHKNTVCKYFPAFDHNAKDSARFFYGVENPKVEYYDGNILLHEFMINIQKNKAEESMHNHEKQSMNIIPEGTRNNTLHEYALKVLTRWGDNSKTHENFMKESQKCVPPMDSKELSTIWNSALKYYNEQIKKDKNYVSPSDYNVGFNASDWEIPPKNPLVVQQLYKIEKKYRKFTIATAKLILQATGITIRLNDMNGTIEIDGLPSKYGHDDSNNILTTLITDIACTMSYKRATAKVVQDSLNAIASENHYHPVIELITKNAWDGKDRLSEIYSMLNLTDELYKTLVKKWAIQTIALLFNSDTTPISAEGVLVFQGNQGIGKTQFFRHLAICDKFFKGGATLDMGNKDCLMSATKVWICELGEIDSTTKKEQSALKAFLTENTDRFRAPYAPNETIKVRRTSFCGTVNPKQYLRDETGNRRYWTIPIEKIELEKVFGYSPEWYTQFWRQIFKAYQDNPKGYLLTTEQQKMLNENNKEYETTSFGEDEFLTHFDIQSDRRNWKWLTASQIAQLLNEEYKQLHISSVQMGKLLKRIEQRLDISFKNKKVHGTKQILCPPLRFSQKVKNEPSIQSLPNYHLINSDNMNTDDELLTDENITF